MSTMKHSLSCGGRARHSALALAIAMGFGFAGSVDAQSTTGTIFGQVPVAAAETVRLVGGSGFDRTMPVDKSGRYSITLPVGTYDVSLLRNGTVIDSRHGVTVPAAGAATVNFAAAPNEAEANAERLSSVTVTANALPAIDVASTQEATVITAEQLKQLPLARSGAAIALLAPGTVPGAGSLGTGPTGEGLVSFGGSSVAENAYYINGFNTSDPLGNSGGITLPYGAIAQQETLTNGYGPEYGRSAGGVISQIGKSGTNTWQFGGAMFWVPEGARGTSKNMYYENPLTPKYYGKVYDYRNGNTLWEQIYDAYIGGPLIKDKLFFFLAAEADHTNSQWVSRADSPGQYKTHISDPAYYAKLDWNITDSNILSFTGVKSSDGASGTYYNYDYATHSAGDFAGYQQSTKNTFNVYSAKFTSYITDDLTLNALLGKMDGTYYTNQPGQVSDPHIIGPNYQDPALCPDLNCTSKNVDTTMDNPDHKSENINLRVDLSYKLGDHIIAAGIDNQTTRDTNDGQIMTGPGYAWEYGSTNPGTPIVGTSPTVSPYVAPISSANWVDKYIFVTQSTVQVRQRAQFIKDTWQVTPNMLLNAGVRDEEFVNYNPDNQPYVRLTKPQWAPRLGFAWDIMGDSSMKLFANAGRYFLALPSGVALREAAASTYTRTYYTYTGIQSNGVPTGLQPIYSYGLTPGYNVPVSSNYEYGQSLDPVTIASRNLGAEYQDSYVLGFQQQINPAWNYGATATWTKLGRIVDDTAEGPYAICNALLAANASLASQSGGNCGPLAVNGSILINPGSSNLITARNANGGYASAWISPSQMGFPHAYRNYYSLELFLEHPWDGKWWGKIDYVYSKSYGTTEGVVQSQIGQGSTSVSATQQWDYGQLMEYSNGPQSNSRKHALKAYGTYQFLPEWSVSGVLTLASGTPEQCSGYYGPQESDPLGYSDAYHWCGGMPSPPGASGYTPWLHTLNLALEYRPEWAAKKLGFQLEVRNVTNEQKLTVINPYYGTSAVPNQLYKSAFFGYNSAMEAPRTVQFGVTYDW
jgi:hypothetical protein